MYIKEKNANNRGIALLYVIIVVGFLVAVSTSVISIAYQQTVLSSYNTSALSSYYASESGLECALYWDVAMSAFKPDPTHPDGANYATTTRCNGVPTTVYPNTGVSRINFGYPDGSVAEVTVDKRDFSEPSISSLGYNTADQTGGRRLERGVNLTYSQNIEDNTTTDIVSDIVLVLDSSGSIGTTNYEKVKAAASVIIENLQDHISDTEAKISIIVYSTGYPPPSTYATEVLIDLSGDYDDLGVATSSIRYHSGGTLTAGALMFADKQLETHGRTDAAPFVILITDGLPQLCANSSTGYYTSCTTAGTKAVDQTASVATALKNKGVTVATVGVGGALGAAISTTYYTPSLYSIPTGVTFTGKYFLTNHVSSDPSLYFDVTDWNQLVQQVQDTFTDEFFKSTQGGFVRQEL